MPGAKLLRGRKAIVTGASKGIGKAIALALAREGAAVCLASRSRPDLDQTLSAVRRVSPRSLAIPVDVTSERSVTALVVRVARALGGIDILVNSAGQAAFLPLESTTEAHWDAVVDTNLKGAFLTMRAVLPYLEKQGRGDIVNISSIAGLHAFPNSSAYCASKTGIIGLSRAVAAELRSRGLHRVRVSTVCPGAVDTPLWDPVAHHPERSRMLSPKDVAAAVVAALTLSPTAVVEELVLAPPEGIL
ncbi:MAG: SDR family oxidoreductase [Chloroflexi bacterium]|nr:SDR family oxidoreductase [Chloroflexota bacterium]